LLPTGPDPYVMASLHDYLVDDQVGLLHTLDPETVPSGAPNFFHYSASLSETRSLFNRPCVRKVGGAAATGERARNRALLRAVSVYCASFCEPERLPLGCSAELDAAHVPPEAFAQFHIDQVDQPGFPWVAFDSSTPVRWKETEVVGTSERILVPAVFVFTPYYPRPGSGEAPIFQPSITGLACDTVLARATLAALCDVIKEDALAMTWQSRSTPTQLRVETLSDANYELVARFERTGVAVKLLVLETESRIPVLVATLTGNRPELPGLVCSAAAGLDPEATIRQVLEELAHAYFHCERIQAQSPGATVAEPESVISGADHVLFWWDPAHASLAQFLFASRERVEFEELPQLSRGSPAADLAWLTERLGELGRRALVAPLTTADVRDLGLHVVRALIPGYHPLLLGAAMQPRGGERLRRAFDLQRDWPAPADLPHPFAACGFYHE
jgi:ribosomal protein S12 methylthiotransferase accessory factor